MTKPKTLDQLRAEKERAETQLAQEQHKLERLENRKKYLEKGERQKRTHRLCNLGGTIESLAPEVKDLTRTEMTELKTLTTTSGRMTTVIISFASSAPERSREFQKKSCARCGVKSIGWNGIGKTQRFLMKMVIRTLAFCH